MVFLKPFSHITAIATYAKVMTSMLIAWFNVDEIDGVAGAHVCTSLAHD